MTLKAYAQTLASDAKRAGVQVDEHPIVLRDSSNSDTGIPASLTEEGWLIIEYVPASLPDDVHWKISGMSAETADLGSVDLRVAAIARAKTDTQVTYRDEGLDRLQGDHHAKDGIAIVGKDVINTIQLDVPQILPLATSRDSYWYLSNPSWGPDAVVFKGGKPLGDGVELRRIEEISFSTATRQDTPLHATLSLHQDTGKLHDPATDASWFEIDLLLVPSARAESLPFAIGRYLIVTCESNGYLSDSRERDILAIDNDALDRGACTISFRRKKPAPSASKRAEEDRRDHDVREAFATAGPQTIKITVSRTKAKDRSMIWSVGSGDAELKLFAPDDDDKGEGPYTVTAEISTTAKQATYRSGVSVLATDSDILADYRFSARMRARGEYATFQHSRLFATFPVDVLTMRFPATVRELDRTSNGSTVQISSLRAGIQLVLEPWDYARARNSWALPLRAQVGFGLFELTDSRFAPTLDIGGAVVVGTLSEEKIPTSVTIGVMYELDLLDPAHGSHLLFTSSVNFLSLFGAQSNSK